MTLSPLPQDNNNNANPPPSTLPPFLPGIYRWSCNYVSCPSCETSLEVVERGIKEKTSPSGVERSAGEVHKLHPWEQPDESQKNNIASFEWIFAEREVSILRKPNGLFKRISVLTIAIEKECHYAARQSIVYASINRKHFQNKFESPTLPLKEASFLAYLGSPICSSSWTS